MCEKVMKYVNLLLQQHNVSLSNNKKPTKSFSYEKKSLNKLFEQISATTSINHLHKTLQSGIKMQFCNFMCSVKVWKGGGGWVEVNLLMLHPRLIKWDSHSQRCINILWHKQTCAASRAADISVTDVCCQLGGDFKEKQHINHLRGVNISLTTFLAKNTQGVLNNCALWTNH